jgi:hypothetical protein
MKVVLLIVLLIGAAFAVPSIRNRLAGPLDPVLAKLGPVGEKIRTPALRFNAHNEIQAIIGRLNEDKLQGRSVPAPNQFQRWVRDKMRGNIQDGKDPWGQPYYLIRARSQAIVGSAGQDMHAGTPDDIRITTPLK